MALGLFSAVTLAAANMSVKMGADILLGRAILSCSAALIVMPFAFVVPVPDTATFQALLIAMPAHFAYQLCLVRAMQRGDLSLVFPVMRGLAPLLTAVSVMVFVGQHLSLIAWIGLAVATASVIAFAWPPKGVWLHHHPDRAALGWALATAVGVSLYNAADTNGVHVAPTPQTFIVWLFMADAILISVTTIVLRRNLVERIRASNWHYGVVAGGLSVLSFGAALYAFSLTETARVSALRETSVVLAALMGQRFLGESFGPKRIIAASTLAAGLIVMQFG
ncbi:MAG: EamA family transporter [Sphingomonadales bacterium]